MKPYRIEVFRGSGRQSWRFRLVAGNGEIVSQSEGYLTKFNCKRTASKIAKSLGIALREVR